MRCKSTTFFWYMQVFLQKTFRFLAFARLFLAFLVIPLCQRSIIQCIKCQDRTLYFHCILYYILFSLLWPRASPESLSMHSRTIPEPLSRDNLLSPHFTCSFLPSLFPLLPACSLFHAPSLVSLFLFCFTCSFFLPPKGTSLLFPSLY